jgi:protein-S-isoprenylcysteine O-methyltransferase Ste14
MSTSDEPPVIEKNPNDLIHRGVKKSNLLGTGLFIGLRALDPVFQYGLLSHRIGSTVLAKVGIEQLPMGLGTNTGTFIDKLGLSPYRLILLGMATGSAVKQIYWILFTGEEEFPPSAAIPVSIFNTLNNTINTILFGWAVTSASLASNETFPQTPLLVGSLLYTVGILTEAVSETQRRNFKRDPKNKGKPFTGGLWQYARHINYTAYTFWRTGFAVAAGGWTWGAVAAAFFFFSFDKRSIPILDEYCTKRVSDLMCHWLISNANPLFSTEQTGKRIRAKPLIRSSLTFIKVGHVSHRKTLFVGLM